MSKKEKIYSSDFKSKDELKIFDFYKNINDSAKEFLKKRLKPIEIPKGNILFFQGDVCKDILLLTEGKIRLYIQSDDANEITLYQLNAGEQCIVNTASTVSQTAAIGSAVTITDIKGYLLDAKSVQQLSHDSYEYQSFLFSVYTLRMQDLAILVHDIKFKKLDVRVLEWLKAQQQLTIQITHEKIANELGTNRVVISRVLKELEKQNKLIQSRGSITLL